MLFRRYPGLAISKMEVPSGFISFQIPGCVNFGVSARHVSWSRSEINSGAPDEGGRPALPRLIGTLWATMFMLKYTEFKRTLPPMK